MTKRYPAALMTICAMMVLASVPCARAGMLTNGGNFPYGGTVCADTQGYPVTRGKAVLLSNCHGFFNQQWAIELGHIFSYAFAKNGSETLCLDVKNGAMVPGSAVVVNVCDNATGTSQGWTVGGGPQLGQIVNVKSNLCLDGGGMNNLTPLVINTCTTSGLSQQWEVK